MRAFPVDSGISAQQLDAVFPYVRACLGDRFYSLFETTKVKPLYLGKSVAESFAYCFSGVNGSK